jgi:hypothetical protein
MLVMRSLGRCCIARSLATGRRFVVVSHMRLGGGGRYGWIMPLNPRPPVESVQTRPAACNSATNRVGPL